MSTSPHITGENIDENVDDYQVRRLRTMKLIQALLSSPESIHLVEDRFEQSASETQSRKGISAGIEELIALPSQLEFFFPGLVLGTLELPALKATVYIEVNKKLIRHALDQGNLELFDRTIDSLQTAIRMIPDGQPGKPVHLNALGDSLIDRYKHLGALTDLEGSIKAHRHAVLLTADDDPDKPCYLDNLGRGLGRRFDRLGEAGDIEQAIEASQRSVNLIADDHLEKPRYLSTLGNAFFSRFESFGELIDIEKAISSYRLAVELTPDGDPSKPGRLSNVGISLSKRFDRHGELVDLAGALEAYRIAIHLTPDGNPDKPLYLNNFGIGMTNRFERQGQLQDLEDAIKAHRHSVDLTPHSDKFNKPNRLTNLGSCYILRFKHVGQLEDVEHAIEAHRQAVDLTPEGHPSKHLYLGNFATALYSRFQRLEELADITEAIMALRQAVNLILDNHPNKPLLLASLGNSLIYRFRRLPEPADITDAIVACQSAVDLTANNHPKMPDYLASLGTGFSCRFEHYGKLTDIQDAIKAHRRSVDLTPDGHHDKATRLTNVGDVFLLRFRRLRELPDLDDSIEAYLSAVNLTSDDHPSLPFRLINFGASLGARFERLSDITDLERQIKAYRRAVKLTPDDHPNKPGCLNNLSAGLTARFEHYHELLDLEDAIDASRRAINLTPNGHPSKPARLNNLGAVLKLRFVHLGELVAVENAIDAYNEAISSTPNGHPEKIDYLRGLGIAYMERYFRFGSEEDFRRAWSLFLTAVDQTSSSASARLQVIRSAVYMFQRNVRPSLITNEELLALYERAIALIPQAAWLGSSIGQRFHELASIGQLINGAVATAIAAGRFSLAVEWLDEGRSVVWGQLLQLRSPLEELRAIRPQLAGKLESISRGLESSSGLSPGDSGRINDQDGVSQRSLQDSAFERIRLAQEYQSIVDEVRAISKFERFLMPKPYSELAHACKSGPVILINVDKSRCDALVIYSPNADVIHVHLPKLSQEGVETMRKQFHNFVQQGRSLERSSREKEIADDNERGMLMRLAKRDCASVLSDLWVHVVHPILEAIKDKLQDFTTIHGILPHVTWCATGPLASLPLHAAGQYAGQNGRRAYDVVVSSYTPTPSALLRQPFSPTVFRSPSSKILVISQSQSPGLCPLPEVFAEVEKIKVHFRDAVVHIGDADATVTAVVQAIDEHRPQCIHLACHGIQDANDPINSAFILHDGPLELRRLMAISMDDASLAFLSACQTAKGDAKLPEEAVHLAAGMLAVGYRAVVGTLWSIQDADAPLVVDQVYRRFMEEGAGAGAGRAHVAYALHDATEILRKSVGEMRFERWAPFVHFGM